MSILKELGIEEKSIDENMVQYALKIWDSIAKPLKGLGELETIVARLCGIFGNTDIDIEKRCALIACSDNGVVEEGISQSECEVTAQVALAIANGTSNINCMAKSARAEVYSIDFGMKSHFDEKETGIIDRHISDGTENFTKGPAMNREQAIQAVKYGIDLVGDMKTKGYRIIVTGEMGIGNTTTSAALASVLLNSPVNTVAGRGAGLSDAGLERKIKAIEKGIEVNKVSGDAISLLSKLGGYDIAAMTGMFLGGMVHGLPIVIDGFISSVAALLAAKITPKAKDYMIASHVSTEIAGKMVLDALGLKAIIYAGMHLGEGTGAILMLPVLDIAISEFKTAHRFTQVGIEQYVPQN